MSKSVYKYNRDRRTRNWTIFHALLIISSAVTIVILYEDWYLLWWLLSYIVVIVIFSSLSIPRKVEVDSELISIHCTLDLTEIPIESISSISKIAPRRLRRVIPLIGSYGFFGFYGHFFDLTHFRRLLIYATEWRYLIEIVDMDEDYYYISCRDRDRFIREVKAHIVAARAASNSLV